MISNPVLNYESIFLYFIVFGEETRTKNERLKQSVIKIVYNFINSILATFLDLSDVLP